MIDSHSHIQDSDYVELSAKEEQTRQFNNIRRELWQIVCNIDDLKHQMLQEFNDNQKNKPFEERVYIKDGKELY